MSTAIDFQSQHYRPINWHKIFKFSSQETELAVLGNHGYFILPLTLPTKNIKVVTPNSSYALRATEIEYCAHDFLYSCYIRVACIPKKMPLLVHNVTDYIRLALTISRNALNICKTILLYTNEHLSKRYAENILLSQHESIQLAAAEIITLLESAQVILNNNQFDDLQPLFTANEFLLLALQRLAELGGGRALLQGNAVELLFHLRLFQLLFLQV